MVRIGAKWYELVPPLPHLKARVNVTKHMFLPYILFRNRILHHSLFRRIISIMWTLSIDENLPILSLKYRWKLPAMIGWLSPATPHRTNAQWVEVEPAHIVTTAVHLSNPALGGQLNLSIRPTPPSDILTTPWDKDQSVLTVTILKFTTPIQSSTASTQIAFFDSSAKQWKQS